MSREDWCTRAVTAVPKEPRRREDLSSQNATSSNQAERACHLSRRTTSCSLVLACVLSLGTRRIFQASTRSDTCGKDEKSSGTVPQHSSGHSPQCRCPGRTRHRLHAAQQQGKGRRSTLPQQQHYPEEGHVMMNSRGIGASAAAEGRPAQNCGGPPVQAVPLMGEARERPKST